MTFLLILFIYLSGALFTYVTTHKYYDYYWLTKEDIKDEPYLPTVFAAFSWMPIMAAFVGHTMKYFFANARKFIHKTFNIEDL
jgi:hypothetical protein